MLALTACAAVAMALLQRGQATRPAAG
jgi:hypothetical protein